jgi:hypothetical protein
MVALWSAYDERAGWEDDAAGNPAAADWLPLQQAACELGISVSTARRMIRKGQLRNRIVPRRGGFQYLIYLPHSRHAELLGVHPCATSRAANDRTPIDLGEYRRARNGETGELLERDLMIRHLEEQVEHLSEALTHSMRAKPRSLPARIDRSTNSEDPYARYRSLVRKKRWWPF